MVGAALAVAGAAIISFHPGDIMQFGSLLILTSSFLYSLHTALVKRYGQEMDFTEFFFHRLMFTTAFLFVFAVLGRELVWPDAQTWLLLLLAGTVDVVISRALYYQTLRMFSMSVHTIILTLSPVVSIIISLFLFGTFPGVQELLRRRARAGGCICSYAGEIAMKVKICGITNLEDALAATQAGADFLGFIFHPKSPRYVTVEQAQAIVAGVRRQYREKAPQVRGRVCQCGAQAGSLRVVHGWSELCATARR